MSVDTSVDGVDGVEGVSSVCRECVESVEPGLKRIQVAWLEREQHIAHAVGGDVCWIRWRGS